MVRLKERPRNWDRFSKWAPGAAMLVLAISGLLLLAAAFTARGDLLPETMASQWFESQTGSSSTIETDSVSQTAAPSQTSPRDTDLALYDGIAERVSDGENYYAVAVEEQRARDFPVRPGLAVRLPTLALLTATFGSWGMGALAVLLMIGVLVAWWVRLEDELGGRQYRQYVILLLVIGCFSGFKPQYLVLHEVWAGMLMALSLALYGREKWIGAWMAAALALSIRELALPFVMLLGTMAFFRGKKVETLAWLVLIILFGLGMVLHLSQVAEVTIFSDKPSSSWLALRGLGGWTSNLSLSSALYWLPGWLGAPLALLPLLGLAGWRSDLGLTAFLLCLGYGVAFMIAGRDNNFYWALIIMPISFIGLAYLPKSLSSLWNSARGH